MNTSNLPDGTVTLNEWQHFAFTYEAGTGKLYRNGKLRSTKAMNASLAWTGFSISSVSQIDELRFWSDARTIQEIRDNMYIELAGTETDLYAYYDFETGTGSKVIDRTGNGRDGTHIAMNDWNTAELNTVNETYALNFDGTNDYVTIANESNFDFDNTDSFSIEAWIKTTAVSGRIVSKMYQADPYTGYEMNVSSTGKLEFLVRNDNSPSNYFIEFSTTDINDGIWHHVAVTYDGTSDISGSELYIDGVLEATTSTANTLTGSILNNYPVTIGNRANLGTPYYFNGYIDEVRVWNTERTAGDISTNMNVNLTGAEAGLVAYYNMESETGTVLTDITGNGNTGTLINMDTDKDWTPSAITSGHTNVAAVGTVVDNYTMKLEGAKYFIFDRIDFAALDTTHSRVVELSNIHNITFNDCIFTGDTILSDTDDNRSIIYSEGTLAADTLTFTNSVFKGGSHGIQIENTNQALDETIISNNVFENQSVYGIKLIKHDKPQISVNDFTTNSTRNDYVGISLEEITTSLQINNNTMMSSTADGSGIYINNATSSSGAEGLIVNNLFGFGTADADPSYGINIEGASTFLNVYHNTFNMTSTAGSALKINGLDNANIKNNIFSSSSATSADIASLTSSTENYNAFNPDFATKGGNSIFQNPNFISSADLHTEEVALRAGTPVGISLDIDNEKRGLFANPPYMGADEFLGVVDWTGAINTDWNNTGNWSSVEIPTRGTTVNIPNVANYPELNSSPTKLAEARHLTIQGGSHIYIAPAKYLTVYKTFTNDGDFTIKSDATGTGSFIPKTTPGDILGVGTTKMEQYLSTNKWHYIGSPITAANGLFSGQYYYWDETIKDRWLGNFFVDWSDGVTQNNIMGWKNVVGNMGIGTGYVHKFDAPSYIVTFDGTFNSGNYTFNLVFTDQGGNNTQDLFDGWNLVANPYPSTINWNSDGITLTNVDNAVYVYNDDGDHQFNNYEYYMKSARNSPYPLIAVNANNDSCHIAPCQSVFVRANDLGAKVKMTNKARQHRKSTFYKSGKIHPDLLKLSVEYFGNTDELAIRFIPEATDDYDGKFDAMKRYTTSPKVPQILSEAPSVGLAINTLPKIYDNLVIPITIAAGEAGKYTISTNEYNFDTGVTAYLIDKTAQKRTDLSKDKSYKVKLSKGTHKNRFEIIFKLDKSLQEEQISDIDNIITENVNIYSHSDFVIVQFENVQGNDNILVIQDVIGKKIIKQKLISDRTEIDMNSFASGNYIVKVITQNKVYKQKVFIK